MDASERTPRRRDNDRPRLHASGFTNLRNVLSENAQRPKKQRADNDDQEDILQKMAKKNEEIRRKYEIAQRDREEAAAMGASFGSTAGSTPGSRQSVSNSPVCTPGQSTPEQQSPEQDTGGVKQHTRTMSQPSTQTSSMSCRQTQSAGKPPRRPPPKGRGRVRAQSSDKSVVGNVGMSTGVMTSTCGQVLMPSTEQPGPKQSGSMDVLAKPEAVASAKPKSVNVLSSDEECSASPLSGRLDKVNDSTSSSLQSASLPSSGSPSPQARKKPPSNRFAGLQGALLGLVTEVHAKNQTGQRDDSKLFSGQVHVEPKPSQTSRSPR
eukprot:scpid66708/ scgid24409/ 